MPGFVGTDSSPALVPGGAAGDDVLVVGSYKDDTLYGLSSKDGATLWTLPGAGGEDSPKVIEADVLVWGGLKGNNLTRGPIGSFSAPILKITRADIFGRERHL